MFLTKIWSVLVTLFAVAVMAAFLLSTPPAEYELEEAYVKSLDGAQGLVDNQLRTRSRQRLDFFSEVGKDFRIVKLLKELKGKTPADGEKDAKELASYLQSKLVTTVGEPAFRRNFDSVAFTDVDGLLWARIGSQKVWDRLGVREGNLGDKIQGFFPGVSRALGERVCSDNTVDLRGVLHLVWSCPVRLVREGSPLELVGTVIGVKEIDDAFALSLLALIGETDAEKETDGAGATEGASDEAKDEKTGGDEAKDEKTGGDKAKDEKTGGDKAKDEKTKGGKAKGGKKDPKAEAAKAAEAAEAAKAAKAAEGRKLRLNIAFFNKTKVVAKSADSPLWAQVGKIYEQHKATIDHVNIGRSPAVEVFHGGGRSLVVVGRLPGEAAGGGNVWAILWNYPAKLGPMAFTKSKIPRSELFKYMPWALFVPLSVVALFLTVFFLFLEGDRPIRRLLNQTRDLAAGTIERIDDAKFRGRFGSIARSVNEAMEKFQDARPTKPALHDKDLDSILGGPDVTDQDFSLDAPAKATSSVLDSVGDAPPPMPGSAGAPPPPPDLPPPPPARPSGNFGVSSKAPLGTIQGPAPAMPGPPQPPAKDSTEARFKEIFHQFVATKKQCGEPTETLTFEAFTTKLRQNEDAVRQKTGCERVDFKVYIKDGKAALKASPAK